jgi:hypothetical protein
MEGACDDKFGLKKLRLTFFNMLALGGTLF